jgi:hypothetical protein
MSFVDEVKVEVEVETVMIEIKARLFLPIEQFPSYFYQETLMI